MDIKEIIRLYVNELWTLRMIAERFHTSHHTIKRILVKNGIAITRRKTLKPFSEDHKKNLSNAWTRLKEKGYVPYNKGVKTITLECKSGRSGKELLYYNMISHLRVKEDIELQWIMSFEDIEKLKFLNKAISKFENFTGEFYKKYIIKFYYDKQFNFLYENWIKLGKDHYLRPSLDHIIPKSKGGNYNTIDNIQFLTWLENRCKNDMSQQEWDNIKNNLNKYFL